MKKLYAILLALALTLSLAACGSSSGGDAQQSGGNDAQQSSDAGSGSGDAQTPPDSGSGDVITVGFAQDRKSVV